MCVILYMHEVTVPSRIKENFKCYIQNNCNLKIKSTSVELVRTARAHERNSCAKFKKSHIKNPRKRQPEGFVEARNTSVVSLECMLNITNRTMYVIAIGSLRSLNYIV